MLKNAICLGIFNNIVQDYKSQDFDKDDCETLITGTFDKFVRTGV